MENPRKSLIGLHFAILLFGFTAILGELISLDALPLVWWRLLLASVSFLPVLWWKRLIDLSSFYSNWKPLVLVSVFLAFHWVTFFLSVKLANASVAVLCIATVPLMTAFFEPLITKRTFRWSEVIFGLLIIPGMFLVVSSVDAAMYGGIIAGLISAMLAAMFTTYNKSIVGKGNTIFFTSVELVFAFLILSVFVIFSKIFGYSPGLTPVPVSDWKYLLLLALVCTTVAYTLSFAALRHISAFTANLSISLEPLYGILLAAFILNQYENMTPGFYLGALMILLVVIIFPIFEMNSSGRKLRKKNARII